MAAAAPTLSEFEHTLIRRQVLLQRLSEGERQKFAPFLREMDKEIREKLTRRELTEYSRDRLETLLKSVDGTLSDILGGYQKQLLVNLDELAIEEAGFLGRAFRATADYESIIPGVNQIRAAVLGNPLSINGSPLLKPFIADWTTAERKQVSGVIRRGVFQGQTNAQIIKAIRGTSARRYQDGLLDVTARHAATLVHTAVQHASSMAMHATVAANEDIIEEETWLSTLDSRTCAQCRSLDQRNFKVGKGPRSPIHPSCRCARIPRLIEKYRFLEGKSTRASVGTSGGKQVPSDVSYYEWLKSQSAGFVYQALGPTRAKLFLEGGLTSERFAALQLDKTWQPLNLDEMRALEPLAFARAGL